MRTFPPGIKPIWRAVQARKRVGQPDGIAGVAGFLASGASRRVTGEVIEASGGSKL